MSGKSINGFIEIAIHILRKYKGKIPFTIYLFETDEKYTAIFDKKKEIDFKKVDKLEEEGSRSFYVKEEDYGYYKLIVDKIGDEYINRAGKNIQNAGDGKALAKELIENAAQQIMVDGRIDEDTVQRAGQGVVGCVEVLEQNPKAIVSIISKMSTRPYLFRHAVSTSIFSIILARASQIESKQSLLNIGLGGFLHDIGLTMLEKDFYSSTDMNADSFKEYKTHPELGKQALERFKNIKTEVLSIILQHHEQPNGAGFPNGLRNQDIFMPAKIVCICDNFVSLITSQADRPGLDTGEALESMKLDIGKYDKQLFSTFLDIFIKTK